MSDFNIPNIDTQSRSKRAKYEQVKTQIPQDIVIDFHDANNDGNLDPKEWLSYEDKGVKTTYYSPHVKDTTAKVAARLGIDVADVEKQAGKKINPNTILKFTTKVADSTTQNLTTTKQVQATTVIKPLLKQKAATASVSDAKVKGKYEEATYTVKKGDNLSKLSDKLNTTVDELKKMNGLTGDIIKPNMVLKYKKSRARNGFNSDISDEKYLAALKNNTKGVFVGHEKAILAAAKRYDIPVSDFYAIMAHETGHGTSQRVKTQYNPGGLRIKGSTEFETYKTLDEGINNMGQRLAEYYKKGQDTLPLIKPTYCPDTDTTDTGNNKYWLASTQSLKEKILQSLA